MDIEEMFRSGKTFDEVIKEVNKAKSKVEKEKKDKEEKEKAKRERALNLNAAKENLLDAYVKYAEIDASTTLTEEEKKEVKKQFGSIVDYISYLYKKDTEDYNHLLNSFFKFFF